MVLYWTVVWSFLFVRCATSAQCELQGQVAFIPQGMDKNEGLYSPALARDAQSDRVSGRNGGKSR